MNPSEFTEDELAQWQQALRQQHALEALLEEVRRKGDPNDQAKFVRLLNGLDTVSTRAAILLADAVQRKCAQDRARRSLR